MVESFECEQTQTNRYCMVDDGVNDDDGDDDDDNNNN